MSLFSQPASRAWYFSFHARASQNHKHFQVSVSLFCIFFSTTSWFSATSIELLIPCPRSAAVSFVKRFWGKDYAQSWHGINCISSEIESSTVLVTAYCLLPKLHLVSQNLFPLSIISKRSSKGWFKSLLIRRQSLHQHSTSKTVRDSFTSKHFPCREYPSWKACRRSWGHIESQNQR